MPAQLLYALHINGSYRKVKLHFLQYTVYILVYVAVAFACFKVDCIRIGVFNCAVAGISFVENTRDIFRAVIVKRGYGIGWCLGHGAFACVRFYLVHFAVPGNVAPALQGAVLVVLVVAVNHLAVLIAYLVARNVLAVYPQQFYRAIAVHGYYFGAIGQHGAVHRHAAYVHTKGAHAKNYFLAVATLGKQYKEEDRQLFHKSFVGSEARMF